MPITLRNVAPADALSLVPLLHDADEDDARVRAALTDPANSAYTAHDGADVVGAAVVRWDINAAGAGAMGKGSGAMNHAPTEILLIAVAVDKRRRGYGAQMLAALVDEARTRQLSALYVGTANSSLATIGFYQRAGFRMDHVRRDYFAYVQPPISEDGIPLRDMLVLRHDLT
jgi:ribosomal protein S18 acetylase RimI-like enzyme